MKTLREAIEYAAELHKQYMEACEAQDEENGVLNSYYDKEAFRLEREVDATITTIAFIFGTSYHTVMEEVFEFGN